MCKGGGASAQTSEVPSFIRDNQGICLILRHPVSSRDGPQNQIKTTEALSSVQPFGNDSSCLISYKSPKKELTTTFVRSPFHNNPLLSTASDEVI